MFWFFLMIAFFVFEAITIQLVAVWFALGSAAAVIAYTLGLSFNFQMGMFIVFSTITLLLIRPFAKKFLTVNKTKTNVDLIIGMVGEVTEPINGNEIGGRVKVSGTSWSAINDDGFVIEVGEKVLVREISGVKLIVDRIA